MAKTRITPEDLKHQLARRLAEYQVPKGEGSIGQLVIGIERVVTRTFKAHWTGFKLLYPGPTLRLRGELADGSFWSEGYISTSQPSWILAFRLKPAKARGSGGPRPEDKLSLQHSVDISLADRQRLIEAGEVADEELIRMEDFDDPLEAIDEFFNYTEWYVLRAIDAAWEELGYQADPSLGWTEDEDRAASLPVVAAINEGLKRSDIIWLTPNTAPSRPIPCWFVYREAKVYVLSGEPQQQIPGAERVRDAKVVTRWKGRDARLVEFDASVRPITASTDPAQFREIAQFLLSKRQSVVGSIDENLNRWMRECVILELTPRG